MPVTPEVVGNKADAVFYGNGAEAPVLEITAFEVDPKIRTGD